MYKEEKINRLVSYIQQHTGLGKEKLQEKVAEEFGLTTDRKVYYCEDFAIRFSSSTNKNFANCVLSLRKLQQFDDRPFLVCVVLPEENELLLANTTCLQKISHSSQNLTIDHIRGTFLGVDILRKVEGMCNEPSNFKKLFLLHESIGFYKNLERLVKNTNAIIGTKRKTELKNTDIETIYESPKRALQFIHSDAYLLLKKDLENRVRKVEKEIVLASQIDNVNIRRKNNRIFNNSRRF